MFKSYLHWYTESKYENNIQRLQNENYNNTKIMTCRHLQILCFIYEQIYEKTKRTVFLYIYTT